ncbi:MAG: hypothetical protein EBS91_04415, partial [Betaproteobacteria bacterium]|nr:hypothetical protein [Betaproteobacteria bacterium]
MYWQGLQHWRAPPQLWQADPSTVSLLAARRQFCKPPAAPTLPKPPSAPSSTGATSPSAPDTPSSSTSPAARQLRSTASPAT